MADPAVPPAPRHRGPRTGPTTRAGRAAASATARAERAAGLTLELQYEVERLLVKCVPHPQITSYLRSSKGLSDLAARNAIVAVYALWARRAEMADPGGEARREQMRGALMDLYQDARKNKAFSPAVTALDRLCKLDGLYAPDKVDLKDERRQDLATQDPDRLRSRIDTLYAKFRANGTARPVAIAEAVQRAHAELEPVGAGGEGAEVISPVH